MRELQAELNTTHFRFRSEQFVIYLWREEAAEVAACAVAEWRGRMRHVISGEIRFFHDWDTFIGGLTELTSLIRVP